MSSDVWHIYKKSIEIKRSCHSQLVGWFKIIYDVNLWFKYFVVCIGFNYCWFVVFVWALRCCIRNVGWIVCILIQVVWFPAVCWWCYATFIICRQDFDLIFITVKIFNDFWVNPFAGWFNNSISFSKLLISLLIIYLSFDYIEKKKLFSSY